MSPLEGPPLRAVSARFLSWQPLPPDTANIMAASLADWHEITLPGPIEAGQSADLPFYPCCQLAALSFAGLTHDVFMVTSGDAMIDDGCLDGTNDPIYRLNAALTIHLTPATAHVYARFFFHFVHGRHGHFTIVETGADIPWQADAPADIRTRTEAELFPLLTLGTDPAGTIHLTAPVLFKTALFRTNILIATRETTIDIEGTSTPIQPGETRLERETLLLEDLPIIRDPDHA
jgi:hypothetical protein